MVSKEVDTRSTPVNTLHQGIGNKIHKDVHQNICPEYDST